MQRPYVDLTTAVFPSPRRFVAQEWSHEGTLQAMVEKAQGPRCGKLVLWGWLIPFHKDAAASERSLVLVTATPTYKKPFYQRPEDLVS